MTSHDALQAALEDVQQAISDFDFADGLSVTAAVEGGHLAVTARGGGHALQYRASAGDVQAQGVTWFTRRALRSLNDRFVAGHLPTDSGEPEHEDLRPPDQYPLG